MDPSVEPQDTPFVPADTVGQVGPPLSRHLSICRTARLALGPGAYVEAVREAISAFYDSVQIRRTCRANNPLTHPVWRPQNSQILEDKEEAVPKKGSRKEGAEASGEVLVMATIWILK